MFFKKRIAPRNTYTFEFTNDIVRELTTDKTIETYHDKVCRHLDCVVGKSGRISYSYHNGKIIKTIGSAFVLDIKEVRDIVKNIDDNLAEFKKTNIPLRYLLIDYFRKEGFFPHGTETILSDENASLKEKIKDLQKEVESLQDEVIRLQSRLDTIGNLADYSKE